MNQSVAVWLVLAVALAAANLPFVNQRLLAVVPISGGRKSLQLRLLELIVLYGLTGLLGRLLESHLGQAFAQGWEFYAVTAALFLTLAFPGFVFRYLMRRH